MDDADVDLLLLTLNAVGDATTAIADVIAIDRGIGEAPDQEVFEGGLQGLARAQRTLRDSAKILLDAANAVDRVRAAVISKSQPPSSGGPQGRLDA